MVLTRKNRINQYPFVDRQDYIQTFTEAVNNIGQKEFSVLVYYGVAGIGKTSLRKELPKYLDEHYVEYPNKKLVWASIDLQFDRYREKSTFLVSLKNELQKKYKINFPAFEIAHAIYWKKAYPEIPLREENYLFFEGDNAFDDFFGVVDKIPYFSIVPATARLIKSSLTSLQKWWKTVGEVELLQLSEKEPLEIEESLPYFWAQDLNNYLERSSISTILFIDTYEALWENHRSDGCSRDDWIKEELILHLPKNVLWVICGRETLGWEEIDSEWSEYLAQYEVDELPRKYCMEYLVKQGITDKETQEVIYKGSKGVPYYLELSVGIFFKIVESGGEPKPENFGANHREITDRFLRFLSSEEKNTLKILSIPRFWDYDLFKYLVKEFNTGYPTNNFEDLCGFSFINTSKNNKYQMHQLMQESLQKTQKTDSVLRIHKAVHEYYSYKFKDIDIKLITPVHENALIEAFYHAKKAFEIKDLLNWFITISDIFYRASLWRLIIPMYEEILQIPEIKSGSLDPLVATTMNNLGELYYQIGEPEKALQFHENAREIFERIGIDNQGYATTLNNIGGYYDGRGEYKKALPFYEQSLKISKIELGPQHPDVAITLSNLGGLYGDLGDYVNAISHYTQALEIFKKSIETEDKNCATTINYATTLNAFADFCRQIEDYETSFTYHTQALKIREVVFGKEHPNVVNSLHNFALLLLDMGEYDEALDKFDLALKIIGKESLSEYPTIADIHVASILSNKAALYSDIGDYDKALLLYQQALKIRKEALGPEHIDVANTLNNLANLYYNTRDYDKAVPLFEDALNIIESKLGTNHPHYIKVMNSLIYAYVKVLCSK